VRLVAQWRRIRAELPAEWRDARISLAVADESRLGRAAALLGPATPGRSGATLLFATSPAGGAVGPDAVERLLQRLDRERIGGTLALVSAGERPAEAEEPAVAAATLAAAWDVAIAGLPADWSDLLCALEVTSTDYLQRAALLLSPLNPTRDPARAAFRFRVARRFGYGASAQMARRCLERVDADGIRGRVSILRALSDTHNVATQGPVWYVEGKAV
jgi:hypothetical protein